MSTHTNTTDDTIRVAVVDDQTLVRAGLAMVIDSQPDMAVVYQASDGAEAIAALGADHEVDVVLMDVRMPGVDGLTACAELVRKWREENIAARVIVLTTFDIDEYALVAIQAGASGFLLKDAPPEQMLQAIRNVHRGDAVLAPSTTRRLLDRLAATPAANTTAGGESAAQDTARLEELTDREREVLVLVAQGLSNQEISAALVVAEATVKTHIGRILTKLGVRDRVQAVVFAYECGLVHPGGLT
ncbi:two component transcriptional regulator, LuxR family [Micrococcales bacterium KH10]|nr:two component transcriptional regulator, LuxR family [Micrococcales bacterium KH10]